jgi:5-methyltetrahydropteroyltriglutamate--homocysteine methyltransferase
MLLSALSILRSGFSLLDFDPKRQYKTRRAGLNLASKSSMLIGPLATCLVGSYPQPGWLIDRARLSKQVPRVRVRDLWLVAPDNLEVAQDDATLLAIRDQERAGIDIITDGEQRRESYSNHFATALDGIDIDNPGVAMSRTGRPIPVPRVTGPIKRRRPVEVRDVQWLRANTDRRIKATIPGPFTMSRQAQDDYYGDEEAMAMDFADAVNAEIKDLFAAGADVVQLDEPWMQQYPDKARAFGLDALNRALNDVSGTVAVHLCFGYAAVVHEKPSGYSFLAELENTKAQQISIEAAQPRLDVEVLRSLPGKTIILGVIDLADTTIETPEMVAARIRAALAHVTPERLVIAPDCGMKYLPRAVAYGKMKAMVDGARIVRQEVC